MLEPILYRIVGPFLEPFWYPYRSHMWSHSRNTFRSDVNLVSESCDLLNFETMATRVATNGATLTRARRGLRAAVPHVREVCNQHLLGRGDLADWRLEEREAILLHLLREQIREADELPESLAQRDSNKACSKHDTFVKIRYGLGNAMGGNGSDHACQKPPCCFFGHYDNMTGHMLTIQFQSPDERTQRTACI